MSYPSQKRLRRGRGLAAVLAALMAAGAGLATSPSAQAAGVQFASVPTGHIQTVGGFTVSGRQGGYGPENAVAWQSQFQNPRGMGFAPNGDLYITDALNQRVRKIDAAGVVSHVAGTGLDCTLMADQSPCHTGDGGAAVNATLNEPHGVAVDSLGNVYIADSKNCVIRKVDSGGTITRYAGTGLKNGKPCLQAGLTEGFALQTNLDQPKSVFMHRQPGGNDTLWIAAFGDSQIRSIKVVENGVAIAADQAKVERVAGNNRQMHYSDASQYGLNAKEADLRHPEGVWVASDGTVYFTDGGNNLVRKVAVKGQNDSFRKISTIAGDVAMAEQNKMQDLDLVGNSDGDGGPAITAHIDKPRGITGDGRFLYVAEEHGSRIRRIDLTNGSINTIAGDGTILEQRSNGGDAFIKGENGPALETRFAMLHDIMMSADGKYLWIADSRNNRVRAVFDPANAPGANIPTGGTPQAQDPPGNGNPVPVPGKSGYWMLGADGRVWGFGDAQQTFGDVVGKMPAGASAVHIEPTPTYKGYWINDDRGGVYAFGDASPLGGIPSSSLLAGEKVTSLSATPSGGGFWLFTSRGRVFTKGNAQNFGDLANVRLNGPVQSSVPTPSGNGYYMVGSDGGVFSFGDAKFHGSTGNIKLNKPVMSLVPTKTGGGYWLVATDGGIFSFGDAGFKGSLGSVKLNKPIVGMVRYGNGYLMVGADGGIFDFSGGPGFKGSLGANPPAIPIVFAATLDA